MKILYFSPHPTINYAAPSGPGTHIREVVHAFEEHGHTVVRVICGGEEIRNTGEITYTKNPLRKFIPGYIWQTLKDYRLQRYDSHNEKFLHEVVGKEKPDLIYERAYYLMKSGYRVARKMGIPYFCEMNAPYPEEKVQMEGNSFFRRKAIQLEKEQVLAADRVFVVSSALKKYIEEKTGAPPSKIIVTPNAVNPAYLGVENERVEKIRQQLGIENTDMVIGFVGSIFPYHGVDLLLKSFEQLVSFGHKNIKLLIVGDGEILPRLKEETESGSAKGKVFFTGNVPHKDVYAYISLMDITVMAKSNWYGSPVKIFEYGALGKIIVAPNVVPVRDVMEDKKDGLLVNDNVRELSATLDYIIAHPEEAGRMASNFREKVLGRHTWYKVADIVLKEVK